MDQLTRETTIIDEKYIFKKFEVPKRYCKGTQQIKKNIYPREYTKSQEEQSWPQSA